MTEGRGRRVLVLGARGMAGHVMSTYLDEAGHSVVRVARGGENGAGRVALDVTDEGALAELVTEGDFDVVINCVGALVAQSESRPEEAIRLNSLLPRRLETMTKGSSTKVVHLSTDCVFSGKTGPYTESAFRDGHSTYDRAKALGELENAKDLTLRMSIIGPEVRSSGTGLMHWFLGETGLVNGFSRAVWNGVTTLELAKAVDLMMGSGLSGIYHLVPEYSISKYELLKLIAKSFGRSDIELRPDPSLEIDKTLIDTRQTSPYRVGRQGYGAMIDELRDWVLAHPDLYTEHSRYHVLGSGGQQA